MKIGYFVGHFPYMNLVNTPEYIKKYAHGGTEIAAYNLAINMAKSGHEIDVFTTSMDSRDSTEIHTNMRVHRYPTSLKIASANPSIKLIYNPLNYELDIVHAHSPIPYSDLPALLYAKRKKVPLILTYQFDGQETGGSFIRNAGVSVYNKFFINRVMEAAEVIIATTQSYANESPYLKRYKDKIVVIPNGINVDEVTTPLTREEARKKLGLHADKPIILFFGSLVQYKGPDILLKAFKRINDEFPNAELIFAGRGPMLHELSNLSRELGVEKHVTFTGFVEDDIKPLYYKSSDMFCLPSTTMAESFGIVNLEAMAAGIPIVASDLGGIPDIVQDGVNGLLAKPGDFESLADSLRSLMVNREMRLKLGDTGKELINNYSWNEITRKTENLYTHVLENW